MIDVKLKIDNAYPHMVIQTNATAQVRAPQEGEDLTDWAAEELIPYTGTQMDSSIDAIYEIHVLDSDDLRVAGQTFEFG